MGRTCSDQKSDECGNMNRLLIGRIEQAHKDCHPVRVSCSVLLRSSNTSPTFADWGSAACNRCFHRPATCIDYKFRCEVPQGLIFSTAVSCHVVINSGISGIIHIRVPDLVP